jgi:hypothetical protein
MMGKLFRTTFIFLVNVIVALALSIHAGADIRIVKGIPNAGSKNGTMKNFGHIEIYGTITQSDLKNLPLLIEKYHKEGKEMIMRFATPLIFLNSAGGDVLAAIEIGKILREKTAWVNVDSNDQCSSACVYILASGVKRAVYPGASIGLHRPYFEKQIFAGLNSSEASKLYSSLIEKSRKYFSDMGISNMLFDDMLKIPSQKVKIVGQDYAISVGLHGDDPAYQEWERAKQEKEYSPEKMRLMDEILECLNSGRGQDYCKENYQKQATTITTDCIKSGKDFNFCMSLFN